MDFANPEHEHWSHMMRRLSFACFTLAYIPLFFAARAGFSQSSFTDPFSKTGFHAGDLYSVSGSSATDAFTGRLVYTIPVLNLPRNGALPRTLSLVYNSNNGDNVRQSLTALYGVGNQIPIVSYAYLPNASSNLAFGWRLSMGTMTISKNVSGPAPRANDTMLNPRGGLVFIDSSGAEHRLFHTDGCPPEKCPAGWDPANKDRNEMQPGIYRSADGEFYQAKVVWTGASYNGDTISAVDLFTPQGLTYHFEGFTVETSIAPIDLGQYKVPPRRVAEVSQIRDLDGNQINLTYDHGLLGTDWHLATISDGTRVVTFNRDYAYYTNRTLEQLRDVDHLLELCRAQGQPDKRSCRWPTRGQPRPEGCPVPGNSNFGESFATCLQRCPGLDENCLLTNQDVCGQFGNGGGGLEPSEPPTYTGRLLTRMGISFAGEQGKTEIEFSSSSFAAPWLPTITQVRYCCPPSPHW